MNIEKYENKIIDFNLLAQLMYLDKEFDYVKWDTHIWYNISKNYTYNFNSIHLFLIENDKKIIGYCLLNKQDNNYHIMKIVIDYNFQSQRLGTLLFNKMNEYYQNKDKSYSFTLEVKVDNNKAIGLYKKMGFIKIKNLKDYYGPKQDAISMKFERAVIKNGQI